MKSTPYLLAAGLFLSGCAIHHHSRVPGIHEDAYTVVEVDDVPPVAAVLEAIQIQMARAYANLPDALRVEENKSSSSGKPVYKYAPKGGSGTFTGVTQLLETDSGNLLGILPFTGYLGSTLSPALGLSAQATSTQTTTLIFSFPSWPERFATDPDEPVGTTIQNALEAAFQELANSLGNPGASEGFANRELRLSIAFSVVRTSGGTLGVEIVPPAPDLNAIGGAPLLGTNQQRTGTYTVELRIPLITPDSADPKRILAGRYTPGGEFYLIERPFERERHQDLISAMVQRVFGRSGDQSREPRRAPGGEAEPGQAEVLTDNSSDSGNGAQAAANALWDELNSLVDEEP